MLKAAKNMLKPMARSKLKQFQAAAGCAWTQKDADNLWSQVMWKLWLTPSELSNISNAWASFVINGDNAKLNEACNEVSVRLA